MQEILEYIIKNLVSNPDAVEITAENQGKTKVFKGFYPHVKFEML